MLILHCREMDSVLQSLATARGSPIPGCSKELRRGSKTEELDECSSSSAIEELLLCTKSGKSGIEDLVGEGNRRVVPDCVMVKTREWYPNPEGVPYMGHMWS